MANDAVTAALAYRAQAPVLDGLMKELGLDGSSLGKLVEGAASTPRDPNPPTGGRDAPAPSAETEAATDKSQSSTDKAASSGPKPQIDGGESLSAEG